MMIALHEGFSFPLQDLVICTQIECVHNFSHIYLSWYVTYEMSRTYVSTTLQRVFPFYNDSFSLRYDECMSEEKKKTTKTSMQILLYMQICDNVILRILCKLAIFIWKNVKLQKKGFFPFFDPSIGNILILNFIAFVRRDCLSVLSIISTL